MRQLAQKHGRILLVERRFLLFQKKNKINPGCPHPISFPPQVVVYKDQKTQKFMLLQMNRVVCWQL